MARPKTRRRYRNPPIEEALVEFRFAPGQDWDLTIPGKLHEKVKATYPGKPRQQRLLQASLRAEIGQPPGVSVEEGIGRVQLVDTDARRLLSLGPDALSVNVLRPYEGWEVFKPRIDAALRAYAEVSGVEKISRIGVRYINKVVVAEPNVDLNKYFLCGPPVPAGLPSRVTSFLYRTEHVFDDDAKLVLTFATIAGEPGSSSFLLDLDIIGESDSGIGVDQALEKVDELHEREGIAFEAVITDDTRGVFDAA
jgi:uncharacterized protein (TIGR04255 family)